MENLILTLILLIIICIIAIAGILIKIYTAGRLNDIDGFRGVYKRKDFKNKNIDKKQ